MYLRPAFIETDIDRIAGLIADFNFGLLVTMRAEGMGGAEGMEASHVPFCVERAGEGIVLTAHLGAANGQCAALDGGTGLAIFSGPHAYVSPSWYVTQPSVPTWDYAAVHVHGRLELVSETETMHAMLADLGRNDPGGFDLRAMPEKYQAAMLSGIRGFRLHPTKIEAQWKMSQNRSVADRQGVVDALRAEGREAVAGLIEATLPIVVKS